MKQLAIIAGLLSLVSVTFSGFAREEVIQRDQEPIGPVQMQRSGEMETDALNPMPLSHPEVMPENREEPAPEPECPPGQHYDGVRCVCPQGMRWTGESCAPMRGAESGGEDGGEATPINLPEMPDDGGEATPINLP